MGSHQSKQKKYAVAAATQQSHDSKVNAITRQLDEVKTNYVRDFIEQTLFKAELANLKLQLLGSWQQLIESCVLQPSTALMTAQVWIQEKGKSIFDEKIQDSQASVKQKLELELNYLSSAVPAFKGKIAIEPLMENYKQLCENIALQLTQAEGAENPYQFERQLNKVRNEQTNFATISYQLDREIIEQDNILLTEKSALNTTRETMFDNCAALLRQVGSADDKKPKLLTQIETESTHLQSAEKFAGQDLVAAWKTNLKQSDDEFNEELYTYYEGKTLLHYAVKRGYVNTVASLLKYRAVDVEAKVTCFGSSLDEYPTGATPIFLACSCGSGDVSKKQKLLIAKLLFDAKLVIDLTSPVPQGYTCLTTVAIQGDVRNEAITLEFMRLLVERGIDVNAQDEMGRTALTHCVDRDLVDCFAFLLSKGADVSRGFGKDKTALDAMLSSRFVNSRMVEVFLAHQKDSTNTIKKAMSYSLRHHIRHLQRESDGNVKRDAIKAMRFLIQALPEYAEKEIPNDDLADTVKVIISDYLRNHMRPIRVELFNELFNLENNLKHMMIANRQQYQEGLEKTIHATEKQIEDLSANFETKCEQRVKQIVSKSYETLKEVISTITPTAPSPY